MAGSLYAYIPDNTEENSFQTKIVAQMTEVTNLVNSGIKAISQEVVSSTYQHEHNIAAGHHNLNENESGQEDTTTTNVLYYEPQEDIYEAKDAMDEMLIWIDMYTTTSADDVVTFKKIKSYVQEKSKSLDNIINALKYEKDNKESVMKYKQSMKRIDKDFDRYVKRIKGQVTLTPGKPLPEPTKD
jgi:hypothetical protein